MHIYILYMVYIYICIYHIWYIYIYYIYIWYIYDIYDIYIYIYIYDIFIRYIWHIYIYDIYMVYIWYIFDTLISYMYHWSHSSIDTFVSLRCLDAGISWWLCGRFRSRSERSTTLQFQLHVQPHPGEGSQGDFQLVGCQWYSRPMGQEKRLLAQHLKQPDSTLLVPRLGIVEYNCGVIM